VYTTKLARFVVPLGILMATAAYAQPLCPGGLWLPGNGIPGVNGSVRAITQWDPDGDGPGLPLLVVGGQFDTAGNQPVRNIAAWDGTRWNSLASGLGDASSRVNALIVHDGELIAGGSFSTADGQPLPYLARWTGVAWEPFQGGAGAFVNAMEHWENSLIVAGGFQAVGAVPCAHIASWDGATWSPLGSGTTDTVNALTVHQGKLVAGGVFPTAGGETVSGIATWNGSVWDNIGTGVNNAVHALASFNNQLYAGGVFTQAGGINVKGFARWTGLAWNAVSPSQNDTVNSVLALQTTPDGLLVGGNFFRIGGARTSHAALWDGSGWEALGDGAGAQINVLAEWHDGYAAGGEFETVGGVGATSESDILAHHIARWDTQRWHPVGGGFADGERAPVIRSIVEFDGDTYVAGSFTSAPNTAANNIARWDGQHWHPVEGGVRAPTKIQPGVYDMAVFDGELFVGGVFDFAGESGTENIARWNGSSWSAFGDGAGDPVLALVVHNNALYAGGQFYSIGSLQSVNRIARWNGFAWSALDTGITGGFFGSGVYELASHAGDLYAGGYFTNAGSVTTNAIARWNGSNWSEVAGGIGGTVSPYVYAMTVANDTLFVGGNFGAAGGNPASLIASWNGTSWSPLDDATGSLGYPIDALATGTASDGSEIVIAGGRFYGLGSGDASRLAVWDGSTWSTTGVQIDGRIETVHTTPDGGMLVGGSFTLSGSSDAQHFAVWECRCQSDVNADGVVDQGDIQAFVGLFLASDPAADFNADGVIDLGDIQAFVAAFLAGC